MKRGKVNVLKLTSTSNGLKIQYYSIKVNTNTRKPKIKINSGIWSK
jgi:hypothetical protein